MVERVVSGYGRARSRKKSKVLNRRGRGENPAEAQSDAAKGPRREKLLAAQSASKRRQGLKKESAIRRAVTPLFIAEMKTTLRSRAAHRSVRATRTTAELRSAWQTGASVATWAVVIRSAAEEKVSGNEQKEHHRDDAVHGEEGGVEFGQVVRVDERVFVEKQQGHDDHSGHSEFSQAEGND